MTLDERRLRPTCAAPETEEEEDEKKKKLLRLDGCKGLGMRRRNASFVVRGTELLFRERRSRIDDCSLARCCSWLVSLLHMLNG